MSQWTKPTVCAVMLTANRPEMARQAVECFRRQTYPNKRLLVYDTGAKALHTLDIDEGYAPEWYAQRGRPLQFEDSVSTIGHLRNQAALFPMANDADIIIHWDDDDWSHPSRIAEQVALLQLSGADCVGYNEMLFWRALSVEREKLTDAERRAFAAVEHRCAPEEATVHTGGEAWLYRNPDPRYALGTSLCYWRKAWEAHPFEATSKGEDWRFTSSVKTVGVSTFYPTKVGGPRMVARIHAGNTSEYSPAEMAQASEWCRVPRWYSYAAGVFGCETERAGKTT